MSQASSSSLASVISSESSPSEDLTATTLAAAVPTVPKLPEPTVPKLPEPAVQNPTAAAAETMEKPKEVEAPPPKLIIREKEAVAVEAPAQPAIEIKRFGPKNLKVGLCFDFL